ncbi:MAG: hypothetical protein GY842_13500 [bacterium]|nr:hypothetical protein [bacterium]
MPRHLSLVLILMGMCGLVGCGVGGGAPPGGVLNQLDNLADEDGDAFSEIVPPEGVEYDDEEALGLKITNTITRSQAMAAAGAQLPDFVSSSVSLWAKVAIDLTYPDGETQTLPGTFPVGPFELAFEFACPESIEVQVTVVASAPIVGDQAVTSFGPYVFTKDEGTYPFECGATVTISTYVNDETGEPGVDLLIE